MSFALVPSADDKQVFRRVKKKVPVLQKSLSILLASLQGENIVIELKNDTEVSGVVETAGHGMDLHLRSAREVNSSGQIKETDLMFLSGTSIRYVHIPPHINVTSHLANYMKQLDNTMYKNKPSKIVDRKRKSESS